MGGIALGRGLGTGGFLVSGKRIHDAGNYKGHDHGRPETDRIVTKPPWAVGTYDPGSLLA